MHINGKLF